MSEGLIDWEVDGGGTNNGRFHDGGPYSWLLAPG